MKRIISILSVLAIVISLTNCEKVVSNKYSGTYQGSLSSSVGSSSEKKDNIKILITNSALDEEALYMNAMPLTKKSDTQYELSGTQLVTIIQLIFPSVSGEQIKKATCKLTFSTDHLDMNLSYELYDIMDVKVITFSGDKVKK